MTAAPTLDPAVPALEPRSSGRSLGWWGTICLIATEGMLFALLLFGNFYLRANSAEWPQGGIEDPELLKSGLRTLVLLGSTIPAIVAERAVRRGDRRTVVAGFALMLLMGGTFLAGHFEEYHVLWPEFTASTNAYGSVFYTITMFHAIHLLVGMVIIGFLLVRVLAGRYSATNHEAVINGTMYWHFVDVVWVFVYSSLYLSVTWL